jgi:hypothetical protein
MLISVPDTSFGRAFGQFMLLFDRPGLDVVQAHAAFAELSALAAREHPEMAWPLPLRQGDGPPSFVTVEGMLAGKWARYADLQSADLATLETALAPWTGAAVRSARAGRGNQDGPHLHVELKTLFGHLQWLRAYCPWQVMPARTAPHQWNDASPSLNHAVARLRRARVQCVEVQAEGTLQLTFTNGTQLVVGSAGWQPNAEVADLHYFLQTEATLFMRVANRFLIQPLDMGETAIPVSIL